MPEAPEPTRKVLAAVSATVTPAMSVSSPLPIYARLERLMRLARGESGDVSVKEYLTAFVNDNPEFLPARIAGGSGMTTNLKAPHAPKEPVTLERIRPGMSAEEMQRVREEIVRVASQTLRGF